MFSVEQRKIAMRFPDEVLFALAEYIYALQPPVNPNLNDPPIAEGEGL